MFSSPGGEGNRAPFPSSHPSKSPPHPQNHHHTHLPPPPHPQTIRRAKPRTRAPTPTLHSAAPTPATARGESRQATAPSAPPETSRHCTRQELTGHCLVHRHCARNFTPLRTARTDRSPPHPPPLCLKFPTTVCCENQQVTASSTAIVPEISHHCVLQESAGHRLICCHHARIVIKTNYRVLV
ncbi:hypothetical protein VPH35_000574 [Triticum aestivum]